jgi:phage replication O-like protein O
MTGQSENYTKISNEILEELPKVKLNGTQYSICLVVWRFTFGFHRCEADLSASFIAEATGSNPRQIKRELQALIERNIIQSINSRQGVTSTLKFNKDISTWKPVTRKTQVELVSNQSPVSKKTLVLVSNSSPELVSNQTPKKETKEIVKEKHIASTNTAPYKEIENLYHIHCPNLPKIRSMNDARKRHLNARWQEYRKDISVFEELFKKAGASDFLNGGGKKGFKADFEWLILPTNMAKVLEGRYDNRGRASPIREEEPEFDWGWTKET